MQKIWRFCLKPAIIKYWRFFLFGGWNGQSRLCNMQPAHAFCTRGCDMYIPRWPVSRPVVTWKMEEFQVSSIVRGFCVYQQSWSSFSERTTCMCTGRRQRQIRCRSAETRKHCWPYSKENFGCQLVVHPKEWKYPLHYHGSKTAFCRATSRRTIKGDKKEVTKVPARKLKLSIMSQIFKNLPRKEWSNTAPHLGWPWTILSCLLPKRIFSQLEMRWRIFIWILLKWFWRNNF